MTIARTKNRRKPPAESQHIRRQIAIAVGLQRHRHHVRALRVLRELRDSHPRVATVWLELAMALDRVGREAEAIPLYRRAIHLGLVGVARRDAMVCCASSLRKVGRSTEATRILKSAIRHFPEDVVVKMFLALGYHDAGEDLRALRTVAMAMLGQLDDRILSGFREPLLTKFRSLQPMKRRGKRSTMETIRREIGSSGGPSAPAHPLAAASG